jgi:hypothetical protein
MATVNKRVAELEAWKSAHLVNHVTTGHPGTQSGVHGHPHPASAADGLTAAEVAGLRALLAEPAPSPEPEPTPTPEPPPPPPPAARPFPAPVTTSTSIAPTSIPNDGSADAGPALRAWLGTVANGSIIKLNPGLYRCDRGLGLINRKNLIVDGNGAILWGTGSPNLIASSPLLLDGGNSDLAFHDLVLEGNNQKTGTSIYGGGEDQQGVAIYGDQRIELANLTIRKTFGDGVYMNAKNTTGQWPEDVWIHDVTLDRIGRQGFTVNSGRRVLIENSSGDQIGMMFLDIEMDTDTQGVDGLIFRGNTAGVFGLNPQFTQWFVGCASQFAGLGAVVKNVTIDDNEVTGGIPPSPNTPSSWSGLASWIGRPARMANWTFTNNRTSKVGTQGVRFQHIDGIVFRGNTQGGQALSFTAEDCTGVVT